MNKLFLRLPLLLALLLLLFVVPCANSQPAAPSGGGGSTFFVTITDGGYGFGRSGRFLLTLNSSPAEYRIVNLSDVPDSAGTYSYSASGAEGKVTINDLTMTFTFDGPNTGSYSLVRGTALNGYQKGRFEHFSGTAPASLSKTIINYSGTHSTPPHAPVNYRLSFETDSAITRLSSSALRLHFNDAVRGQGLDHLVFASTNSGLFVYKIGSGKTYEIGTFTLEPASVPVVTKQPQSTNALPGTSITLDVALSGTRPFTFQWQKNGVPIPGATTRSLTLNPLTFDHEGRYRLRISNFLGSVLSTAAVVTPLCQTKLDKQFATVGMEGGQVLLEVQTIGGECDWGIQNTNTWVTTDAANQTTLGDAQVKFLVEDNTSSQSRVAHIKVGTQQFRIFQEGTYAPDRLAGFVIRLDDQPESEIAPVNYYSAFTTNVLSRTLSSGTITNLPYLYQRTGETSAEVVMTNIQESITLEFASPTSGTFVRTNLEGTSTGTFVLSQIRTDINEDGRSDLIWQHTTSSIRVSYMDGTSNAFKVDTGTATTRTRIVAIGDLNKDGFVDSIRLNTNMTLVADLNAKFQTGVLSQAFTLRNGVRLTPDWNAVAAQDLDQDGNTDLLFQHTDGRVAYWRMNGTQFTNSFSPRGGTSAGFGWRAAASADMNGDRDPDILFWNRYTGGLAVWFMQGGDMYSAALLYQTVTNDSESVAEPLAIGPNWRLRAVADMNFDGHNDLVLQNVKNGEVWVRLMNGIEQVDEYKLAHPARDPNWILIGPR
ncbi:MAG: FG-GAP-like repeat-containing protein [Limisphaerales bacterium]